jgi:tRNA (cytosine49-C5)-methyltransferase
MFSGNLSNVMKNSRKVMASELAKEYQFLERTSRATRLSKNNLKLLLSVDRRSIARVNGLSSWSKEKIVEGLKRNFDVSALPWSDWAFVINGDKARLAGSDLFQRGHIYIQNASSLIPPLALEPKPGDEVLDVCAAPGGKASFIASLSRNKVHLWLNDALKNRLRKLRDVMDIFGVNYNEITGFPGQYIDKFIDKKFDKILLDAQCTSEARVDFRDRRPLLYWSLKRVHEYSRLQKKMLIASFKLLKPQGVLVYSTCTFSPEENEEVINYLLKHHPDASVEEIKIDGLEARPGITGWNGEVFDRQILNATRVLPTDVMEGFFVCKIRKGR